MNIPEGYVLVPKEPTEAMIRAGRNAGNTHFDLDAIAKYRAMVSASLGGLEIDSSSRADGAASVASDLTDPDVGTPLEEVRTQLFTLCEATEDECLDLIKPLIAADKGEVSVAFLRGRRSEAKAIRRAMDEVFRELIAKAVKP